MGDLKKSIGPTVEVQNKLQGFFKIVAVKVDEDGNEHQRVLADWFHNVITDQGLDWIGQGGYHSSSSNYLYAINGVQVGSGSTPETTSDTALEHVIATTNNVQSGPSTTGNSSTRPYWVQGQVTWRFGLGVAAGNLSEVGATGGYGNPSNSSSVFSRTLIKDSTGTPVTITVESDEYLDVTYALRIYPVGSTGTFNMTVHGVDTEFTYTTLPCSISTFSLNPNRWSLANSAIFSRAMVWFSTQSAQQWLTGTIGTETTQPSGTTLSGATGDSGSISSYVAGSHTIDSTMNYTLNSTNGTLQSCLCQLEVGCFQFQISPTLTKTSSDTFSITFRMSWDRYTE